MSQQLTNIDILCDLLKHTNTLMIQQINQTCQIINNQTETTIRLNKIESDILSIKKYIDTKDNIININNVESNNKCM
jgi:hypothetical protein